TFFFASRRRHTRFSRDWSSDVCSSDLEVHCILKAGCGCLHRPARQFTCPCLRPEPPSPKLSYEVETVSEGRHSPPSRRSGDPSQIGRASCRERGWRTDGDG